MDAPCFVLCLGPRAVGLYSDILHPGGLREDSGTDIRFAEDVSIPPSGPDGLPTVVDLAVRARCFIGARCSPYQIMARSSIAKTPLILANAVGLIDREYTGSLKVAIHNLSEKQFNLRRGESLFQLVTPSLEPATVRIASDADAAFADRATLRGEGSFGSTGPRGAGKDPQGLDGV